MNILFLSSKYYPDIGANGNCCQNIAEALIERGHKVKVLTLKDSPGNRIDKIQGVSVERIYYKLLSKRKKNLLYKIFRVYNWPFITPYFTLLFLFKAIKIVKKEKIQVVIPIIKPFAFLKICYYLKLLKQQLIIVPYILDSLYSDINLQGNLKRYKKKKIINLDKMILKKFDYIALMKYDYSNYTKKNSKTLFFDLPMITKLYLKKKKEKKQDKTINLIYAGNLSKDYRNPIKLIEALNFCTVNYRFTIYSDSNFFDKKIQKNHKIKLCNSIPRDILIKKYNEADFLISIGNSVGNQIPSKIFEYISLGKPIIHLITSKDDPVIPYLEKYPLTTFLSELDSIDLLNKKLEGSLLKTYKPIKSREILEKFKENTPKKFILFLENIMC